MLALTDDSLNLIVSEVISRIALVSEPDWLTSKEAAEHLRLSVSHVSRLTSRGTLPHVRVEDGRKCLYDRHELDQWLLKSRQERGTSQWQD